VARRQRQRHPSPNCQHQAPRGSSFLERAECLSNSNRYSFDASQGLGNVGARWAYDRDGWTTPSIPQCATRIS